LQEISKTIMIKIGNIELPDHPLLLAPMEDVSDPPFRRLCKKHGADLMYSEFISSEGLIRDAIKSKMKLDIFDYERPVGIQIFGGDEESINIDEVAERLQDVGVQALTIHARTRAQMYKGHSDWTHIERIKNNQRIKIPIFGNGDIDSPQKALEYKEKFGLDGMMIGRAAIGYPWIFDEIKHYFQTGELLAPPTIKDRLEAAKNHLIWSMEWKGERLGIVEMRRHYTNYFKGIHSFKPHRLKLVTTDDVTELLNLFDQIAEEYKDYVIGEG